jgi:hypothetical protein
MPISEENSGDSTLSGFAGVSESSRPHSPAAEIEQVEWPGEPLATPEGLEPPTLGSEDQCSIQLSYGAAGESYRKCHNESNA